MSNSLQEFEYWIARYNNGEDVFQYIIERSIRMFYNGNRSAFLSEYVIDVVRNPDHGLNLNSVKDWEAGKNYPDKKIQGDIISMLYVASDRWLRDQKLMIAAKIDAASSILSGLAFNDDSDDLLKRIGPEVSNKIKSLSGDLLVLSGNLKYRE